MRKSPWLPPSCRMHLRLPLSWRTKMSGGTYYRQVHVYKHGLGPFWWFCDMTDVVWEHNNQHHLLIHTAFSSYLSTVPQKDWLIIIPTPQVCPGVADHLCLGRRDRQDREFWHSRRVLHSDEIIVPIPKTLLLLDKVLQYWASHYRGSCERTAERTTVRTILFHSHIIHCICCSFQLQCDLDKSMSF